MTEKSGFVIQFAMRGEAEPFLRQGGFDRVELEGAEAAYSFELHRSVLPSGRTLWVGVAGLDRRFGVEAISKVPAAILAHVLVSRCSPSLMINAGTAGGFEARGAKIGDLFLGTKAVCHDRRIPLGGAFEAFGRGDFPVLHEERLLRELGARPGVVSTGDSLDCTPEDFRQLCALEADVKEMEAAAIAQVCESQGVPLVLLKSVTDFVDHHEATQDQFLRNYAQAVGQLSSGLWRLIRFYDSQCAL